MTDQQALLPRILIVGTTPYSPNESSRALDTYFHNWPKQNLRMIYSNANPPHHNLCGSHFRITDYELLQRLLHPKREIGTVFEGSEAVIADQVEQQSAKIAKYKKKNSLRYYIRKFLWERKRWLTPKLEQWVDDFKPEALYICFSDDYFILDIALYFANKYQLPIIAQISDDYFFKKHSLLLQPFLLSYKKLFVRVMSTPGFAIYIADKIANKYNSYFIKQGTPIYLSSQIKPSTAPIVPEFNYLGKVNLGRLQSLALLGDALNQVNNEYSVSIYSNGLSNRELRYLQRHHCAYQGYLSYEEVAVKMNSGAFNIIASGFAKKNIDAARYSLSTKVADALICPGPILAIGPEGDGAIDYLLSNHCAIVLKYKSIDIDDLSAKLANPNFLRDVSQKASMVYKQNHEVDKNRLQFESRCIECTRRDK